jgi:CRISPR/Cas system-associated exonuclease Cas4 (RecB family)
MSKISASHFNALDYCKRAYLYRHVLKQKPSRAKQHAREASFREGNRHHHTKAVQSIWATRLYRFAIATVLITLAIGALLILTAFNLPYATVSNETVLIGLAAIILLGTLAYLGSNYLSKKLGVRSATSILGLDHGKSNEIYLYSKRLNLDAKPDEVRTENNRIVALEHKSSSINRNTPYEGNRLQLLVAIEILKEKYGSKAADYGHLIYQTKSFKVNADPSALQKAIDEARQIQTTRNAERSHNSTNKCRKCEYEDICEYSIA